MKNKHLLLIISFFFYLSGCTITNRRTNYFVEGSFVGLSKSDETTTASLLVTQIDQTSFQNKNGKNVVFDDVKKKYYELDLTIIFQSSEPIKFDLQNLKASTAISNPVSYRDENSTYITPQILDGYDINFECSYTMQIRKNNIFSSNLFFVFYKDFS